MHSECWVWTKARSAAGYGQTWRDGKLRYVHAYVYEQAIGPIPPGHEVHHICENKACYNPTHLEALTRRDHLRRHYGLTCPRCGSVKKWGKDGSWCTPCHAIRARAQRAAKRESTRCA